MELDDFDLDLRTAERAVALADPRFRAAAVAKLTGGGNSAVFEVGAQTGQTVVVKVYSDLFQWKMEKEVFVYDRVQQHGLVAPVPTLLAADDSKTLLPHNVVVLTKLDGVHVDSLLEELDESDLVEINRQVGAILHGLHQIHFDEYGYVGTHGVIDGHRTNLDYMRFQFGKKLAEFDEYGGDAELRRRMERHVSERDGLLAPCPQPSLCHNDCYYGNVLVLPERNSWRVSGLVDFENVLAGDPLLDLAKTHCYSPRRTETTLAALADGYGDLRADWREALDLYVLYHWLELWDWFAYLGQSEPLAGLADEMQLLLAA